MHSAEDNRAAIGRVRKPHGVRGGLKVTLYSIDLEMLQDLEQLFVNMGDSWRSLSMETCQGYDDYAIIKFKGIDDRSEAETYRDLEIFTLREALPVLADGEYYIDDLIGCEVRDEQDEVLGQVVEILTPGAHEVLVIQQGEVETLIPLVDEWVNDIDLVQRQIRVNSPEAITDDR